MELPKVTVVGKAPTTERQSPLQVSLVSGKDIRARGSTRLDEVLEEVPGVSVIQDHGAGVQVQGLDPDYTLILIDGEPAVGRTAGTLDLSRFAVGGLEQVEIVEGPSSSLYGSEAMGGVINLVTRRPSEPLSYALNSRYGTYNTLNLNGEFGMKRGGTGILLFADREGSDGFDANPRSIGNTSPERSGYTLQPKLIHDFGPSTHATLGSRFSFQEENNRAMVQAGGDSLPSRDRSTALDWNGSLAFEHGFSRNLGFTAKAYATRYKTLASLRSEAGDSSLSRSVFDQSLGKGEAFFRFRPAAAHEAIAGGGGSYEAVAADRIAGGERGAYSAFAFLQEDWIPSKSVTVQASGRFDAHQDYAAHFSPRLAGLYRPWGWLALRASLGNGFKAPTSQELYLDFTNPEVGYSVFGSTGAREGLERLASQGLIEDTLRHPGGSGKLRPEDSWSYDAGFELSAGKALSFRTNFFRNNVEDMIETAAVARKKNGQNVFTYFNLKRIHTQGMENNAVWKPVPWLSIAAGYEYLLAEDEEVLEDIAAGRIFKVGRNGHVRPVQAVEYGGLPNRSRHTANLKLSFDGGRSGFSGSLRGTYRSRYGYADLDFNGIIDSDGEYMPGYTVWNVTVNQRLTRFLSAQAGVNDAMNETDPALMPSMAGRTFFAGLSLHSP
jgi:outer membrane receptor for ferrienterochelin and colicins